MGERQLEYNQARDDAAQSVATIQFTLLYELENDPAARATFFRAVNVLDDKVAFFRRLAREAERKGHQDG